MKFEKGLLLTFLVFLGGIRMNGSAVPVTLKNRPRIPTPDVTKEVVDRENRLAAANNMATPSQISQGVALMAHQLSQGHATSFSSYNTDGPEVQVVLTPIQELDGGSHNNTLHANSPGTAALAQAVLSPTLGSAGIGSVLGQSVTVTMPSVTLTPVTVSQLGTLHTSASYPQITNFTFVAPLTPALSDRNISFERKSESPGGVQIEEINSGCDEEPTSAGSDVSQASTLEEKDDRSRKTSTTSQTQTSNSLNNTSDKKREVYV